MGNDKKKFLNLTIREALIAMKDWLIKNKVPAFVYFLIGMMIVLGIFSGSFREHFLFDKYGKFQWIGVSAIVGGLGLYLNASLKKKELRANLISKNELEILENFRHDCSNLNSSMWDYNNKMDELVEFYKKNNTIFDENGDPFGDITSKVTELNNLYANSIKPHVNLIRLDTSIHDNSENLAFFKKDLNKLINTLDKVQNNLTPEHYENTNFKDDYQLIVSANNDFLDSAQEYVSVVFNEQVDRIS